MVIITNDALMVLEVQRLRETPTGEMGSSTRESWTRGFGKLQDQAEITTESFVWSQGVRRTTTAMAAAAVFGPTHEACSTAELPDAERVGLVAVINELLELLGDHTTLQDDFKGLDGQRLGELGKLAGELADHVDIAAEALHENDKEHARELREHASDYDAMHGEQESEIERLRAEVEAMPSNYSTYVRIW